MKRKLSIGTWVWAICLASIALLSSCEPLIVDPCKEQTDNRILKFREYCYDAVGNVKLAHPEGYAETEWMIPIRTEADIHTVFEHLTRLSLHTTMRYEYSYRSEDNRFIIKIIGQETPINGKYASLYLWIEGCPEIETIHFIHSIKNCLNSPHIGVIHPQ